MIIEHIDDLLPAVAGRPEFVVRTQDGYTFIDYVYQGDDTFDDPRRRECRGIKFDAHTGRIIARPLRKFFNHGERGAQLDLSRPHVVTYKLDGSMIHPAIVEGMLVLMTRKGRTEIALRAENYFIGGPADRKYRRFMTEVVETGWTPVFEFTSPDNQIVLRYDEPELTLLALRTIETGRHMSYHELCAYGREFDIPVVGQRLEGMGDIAGFLSHTRGLEGAEGYVVAYDDGEMIKVKSEEYVLRHRAINDMNSRRKVLALVLDGHVDDTAAALPEAERDELLAFNSNVQDEIDEWMDVVLVALNSYDERGLDRKTFATTIVAQHRAMFGDWTAGCLFGALDGRDLRVLVKDSLRKNPEIVRTKWRGQ